MHVKKQQYYIHHLEVQHNPPPWNPQASTPHTARKSEIVYTTLKVHVNHNRAYKNNDSEEQAISQKCHSGDVWLRPTLSRVQQPHNERDMNAGEKGPAGDQPLFLERKPTKPSCLNNMALALHFRAAALEVTWWQPIFERWLLCRSAGRVHGAVHFFASLSPDLASSSSAMMSVSSTKLWFV